MTLTNFFLDFECIQKQFKQRWWSSLSEACGVATQKHCKTTNNGISVVIVWTLWVGRAVCIVSMESVLWLADSGSSLHENVLKSPYKGGTGMQF